MPQTKTIRVLEAYSRLPDRNIVNRAMAVATKLTGNDSFTGLPIDLAVLKTDIDVLSALMAEALDGSKKVIAEKNKQREVIIQKLRVLGRYVEVHSNNVAALISSGFELQSTTKAKPQGLSQNLRSLDHGDNSGDIVMRLKGIPNALSYELRFAAVEPDIPGTAIVWKTEVVTGVRKPVTLSGLKPGTTYAFQFRWLAKSGYSDWSDSVTLMCT